MKSGVVLFSILILVPLLVVNPARAQGQGVKKLQQGGVPAGGGQGGGPQRGMAGGNAMPGGGQLAQMMLANFDQNGDAALNLFELQMALDALLQRLNAHRVPGPGDVAMGGGQGQQMMRRVQHGQGDGRAGAGPHGGGQGRSGKAGGARGGGGGKGGGGR
ncbi:MAG: hypothetical protein MUF48_20960 [Pirellulaceae bacterium]|nr:hypothetical protein [Pirellulaceae bacterium]